MWALELFRLGVLAVIGIVWLTNPYNFMDDIDGFKNLGVGGKENPGM